MFNTYKPKKSKWISLGIIKSIQYRYNMYKKLRLRHPMSVGVVTITTNLSTYNKILKNNMYIM